MTSWFLPRGPTKELREVSSELRQAIEVALADERQRVSAAAATIRLAGGVTFLILAAVAWLGLGGIDWSVYVVPLAVYTALAIGMFAIRRRPLAVSLSWLATLVDIAMVGIVQARTLPLSPHPAGVAGFSLGVFALLIALSGLGLRPPVVYFGAVASILAQCFLMHAANVAVPPMFAAAGILLLEARVMHALTSRLHLFVHDLASTEAERRFETRRFAELERAQKTIAMRNEQLVSLQTDKDRLTQLLVHDLRAPLAVIVSHVELAQLRLRKNAPTDRIDGGLDAARMNALRLTGMISDLLNIARLEEGFPVRPRTIALGPLLDEMAQQTLGYQPTRKIHAETAAPPGLFINADPELLRRVLENLTSNAARHVEDGQRIRLSASTEDGVVIRVQNDGTPIPPELRDRLFEKYQQARGAHSGWGLGLYFCRLAMEAHGGTIVVEDAEGWDVTIALRLPRPAENPV